MPLLPVCGGFGRVYDIYRVRGLPASKKGDDVSSVLEYKTTVFRPGRFLCQCVCVRVQDNGVSAKQT